LVNQLNLLNKDDGIPNENASTNGSSMLNVQRGHKLGLIGCAIADKNSHNACG
jgi:hypothetical protein